MNAQGLGQVFGPSAATSHRSSRSAAECIGRVGGLAAALGVGVMLFAAPWTAAADTDSAGSSTKSDTSTSSPRKAGSPTTATGVTSDRAPSVADDTSGDMSGVDADAAEGDADAEQAEEELDDLIDLDEPDDLTQDGDADVAEEPVDEEVVAAVSDDSSAPRSGSRVSSPAAAPPVADPAEDRGPSQSAESAPASAAPTRERRAVAERLDADDESPAARSSNVQSTEPVIATASVAMMPMSDNRSGADDTRATPAPAKALQAQPGAFLGVAGSLLSAVIAPFMAPASAPAAPAAAPAMWGVLAWVRRELEDTFANVSISVGGRQIVQTGTAYATSEGFGSIAIAYGENATATATGLFNRAVARGDNSTAEAGDGNFNRARVYGDDNEATATGGWFNSVRIVGDGNDADASGGSASVSLRGDGNTGAADGRNAGVRISGDTNTVDVAGDFSRARVYGNNNTVDSVGAGNGARILFDGNAVSLSSTGGSADARIVGYDNEATVVAEGGRAAVSVTGFDNDATAEAGEGALARVTIRGDRNSGSAAAEQDSVALVRIYGDDNTGVSTADGDGNASTRISGDGNVADATNARARIAGDHNTAIADGAGSVARVRGESSSASALGEDNTALVWGTDSVAIAGPGTDNTAISLGSSLIADTGPGDGQTVYGQPDPNIRPVAGADGATVAEGSSVVIDVLGNDSDADGELDPASVSVSEPAHGTVTVNLDGTVTYVSDGAEVVADSFTYTVEDLEGAVSNSATVTVTISPVDDAPVAVADSASTAENTTVTIDVVANDTDVDGGPLTVEGVTQGDNGATVAIVDDQIDYTPGTHFTGTDTFIYTLNGGSTGTVTVTVNAAGENQEPTAAPTFGTPDEDGVITGDLGAVDPDGDALTYTVTDAALSGSLLLSSDGTFTYTPTLAARLAAFETAGADVDGFTVEISDGVNPAITVTVDDLPILPGTPAVTDTITGVPSPLDIVVSPDGSLAYVVNGGNSGSVSVIDTSTGMIVDTVAIGSGTRDMAINPAGTRIYVTRNIVDANGAVAVIDATTRELVATVGIGENPEGVAVSPDGTRVYAANLNDGTISVIEAATNTVIATAPVGSGPARIAVSPDGTRIYVTNNFDNSVSILDAATNTVIATRGVGLAPIGVTFSPDGTRAYVANADSDSVSVIDSTTGTVTATVDVGDFPVEVAFSPDASLAYVANYGGDSVSVIDTGTGTVVATIALDQSFDDLNPTGVAFSPDGSVAYVANASDDTVSVISVVAPADTAAVIGTDTVAVDEDTTGNVVDVLANDSDADGPLSVTGVSDPVNGTVTVAGDGLSVAYTPDPGFTGNDTFTYTVTDPLGGTGTGTVNVTVTVADGNEAPTANPSVGEPDPGTGTLTGSLGVTDPEDDPISYTVTDDVDSGTLTLNADGTFTYTPTLAARVAAFGTSDAETDSFTVEISDGSNPAVAVTVSGLPILAGTPAVVDTITGVDDPSAVAISADGTTLYVTSLTGGTVSVIDTATNTIVSTFAADNPDGVVFSLDGTRAYIANNDTDAEFPNEPNTVSVIDTATNTLVTTITVGDGAHGLAISRDGTRVYVTNDVGYEGDTVSVIDTATDSVVATVPVGNGADGVAVSPDGSRVYVTNSFDDTVSVIDTAANTVTVIDVGDEPRGVAVSADGARAYVINSEDDSMSVIDTVTNAVVATVSVEPDAFPGNDNPLGVAVSPDGSLLYVTVNFDGSVSVVDTATNAVITSFTVGEDPGPVAFSPDGNRAYVVNTVDGTVSVIALVTSVDTPAVLGDDSATVVVDSAANIIDVLANDSDADGALTITAVSDPPNGMVAIAGDGLSVTFTPEAGFAGVNTFTYTVTDPLGGTGTATVTVDVQAASGVPTLLGIAETSGSPTRMVVGPDGRIYVSITTGVPEGGSNPTDTWENSVYAIDPQDPTNLILIADSYDGPARGGLVFGPNDIAYQASYDYDTEITTVRVIDLSDPAAPPTVVQADGSPALVFNAEFHDVVVDSEGNAYLLTSAIVDDERVTHLTVIAPDPTDVRRAQFAGEEPRLTVKPDGGAYLVVETGESLLELATVVYAIDASDPAGSPIVLEVNGAKQEGVGFDAEGNLYVTTSAITFVPPADLTQYTHIGVLASDGSTHIVDLEGVSPGWGVVIGPDGNAYQAVQSTQPDSIQILVFDAQDPNVPETIEIEGTEVVRPLAVGPGGESIFVTTRETDADGEDINRVVVIDRQSGQSVAVDLTGTLESESSGGLVTDADGRGYIATRTRVDVDGDGIIDTVTHVTVIDPQSPANPLVVDVVGATGSTSQALDVAVGPNGLVYLTTYPPTAPGSIVNATQVTVIDPDNIADPVVATFALNGAPVDGVVFDEAGRAHQATNINDPENPTYSEDTTNIAVIGTGPTVL